jgi:mono/diheme cytochrome c family protein
MAARVKVVASVALMLAASAYVSSFARAEVPAGGAAPDGKALYREKCIMCHDKAGMGTGLLSRRLKVAELLLRSDLTADFVVAAARGGIGNMPAIPRGEVSDSELKAIADFLAQPPDAKK